MFVCLFVCFVCVQNEFLPKCFLKREDSSLSSESLLLPVTVCINRPAVVGHYTYVRMCVRV